MHLEIKSIINNAELDNVYIGYDCFICFIYGRRKYYYCRSSTEIYDSLVVFYSYFSQQPSPCMATKK